MHAWGVRERSTREGDSCGCTPFAPQVMGSAQQLGDPSAAPAWDPSLTAATQHSLLRGNSKELPRHIVLKMEETANVTC